MWKGKAKAGNYFAIAKTSTRKAKGGGKKVASKRNGIPLA